MSLYFLRIIFIRFMKMLVLFCSLVQNNVIFIFYIYGYVTIQSNDLTNLMSSQMTKHYSVIFIFLFLLYNTLIFIYRSQIEFDLNMLIILFFLILILSTKQCNMCKNIFNLYFKLIKEYIFINFGIQLKKLKIIGNVKFYFN